MGGRSFFAVDSDDKDTFCPTQIWKKVGKLIPQLHVHWTCYVPTILNHLQVLNNLNAKAAMDSPTHVGKIALNVSLLHTSTCLAKWKYIHLELMSVFHYSLQATPERMISQPNQVLSKGYKQLCVEFSDLFKPKIGSLRIMIWKLLSNQMPSQFSANHKQFHLQLYRTSMPYTVWALVMVSRCPHNSMSKGLLLCH